jgi:hypothetical protein
MLIFDGEICASIVKRKTMSGFEQGEYKGARIWLGSRQFINVGADVRRL